MRFFVILLGMGQAVALLLILLYCAIMVPTFQMGFYQRQFERNRVEQVIGIERDELIRVTTHLMAYMRGREDDLQITAVVQGTERPFFSQREIDHMVDVRDLFAGGALIFQGAVIVFVVTGAFFMLIAKSSLTTLARIHRNTNIAVLTFLALLTVVIALDFTRAFDIFHEIFFNNDYWILNPQVDLLINMVPEPFFVNIGIYVAVLFVVLSVAVIVLAGLYLRRARRMRRWFT